MRCWQLHTTGKASIPYMQSDNPAEHVSNLSGEH